MVDMMYIGELVPGKRNKDGYIAQDSSCLTMESVINVPYDNAEVKILCNDMYKVCILSGVGADNDEAKGRVGLSTSSGYIGNDSTYAIPSGHNYYVINVKKYGGDKIANAEEAAVKAYIVNHTSPSNNIDNYIRKIDAARLSYRQTESGDGDIGVVGNLPVFIHTSDPHGDYYRMEEIDRFASEVGASCVCVTGDFVAHHPAFDRSVSDNPTRMYGTGFMKDIIKNSDNMYAICPGNHEYIYEFSKPNLVYDAMYKGIEGKLGKKVDSASTYYTDIKKDKIRIISIDLYEPSTISNSDDRQAGKTYFSQKTIDTVEKALLTNPKGYGVIILMHSPQTTIPIAANKACSKFFQKYKGEETASYRGAYNYTYGDPIADMVNAFINRNKIAKTYGYYSVDSNKDVKLVKGSSKYSISVNADFSNASGEFICYMTGHRHRDSVYYLNDDKQHKLYKGKQLMLNVTCTTPAYGADDEYPYLCDKSDIYRDYGRSSQSFNAYIIDRLHKTVKIVRVGADMNYNLESRDVAVVPYA